MNFKIKLSITFITICIIATYFCYSSNIQNTAEYHYNKITVEVFTSNNCVPCKFLKQNILPKFKNSCDFIEIDIDSHPEYARIAEIRVVPSIRFLHKEKYVLVQGLQSFEYYKELFETVEKSKGNNCDIRTSVR